MDEDVNRLIQTASDLCDMARRVDTKFGFDEDGNPKDWTEWTDLREAILAVRNAVDVFCFDLEAIKKRTKELICGQAYVDLMACIAEIERLKKG